MNAADLDGFIPLHLAAGSGSLKAINALIAAGSEVSRQTTGGGDFYNCGGVTPLHCVVGEHDDDEDEARAECVAALIKAGASLDLRDHSFSTPIQDAAENGLVECAGVLVAAEKVPLDAARRPTPAAQGPAARRRGFCLVPRRRAR